MNRVLIVDYGVGNLHSVSRAVEELGGIPELTSDPMRIRQAERLILPGDGAFVYGMQELHRRGLFEAIREFAETGRPFLGICLGMQLMLDESEEFGHCRGLGLLPGRVVAMPTKDAQGHRRIPQIGWNGLLCHELSWEGTVLDGLSEGASVYFVHSYMAVPTIASHRLADCLYDGLRVSAVIRRDSLTGCQFHPEKSGPVGLRILGNFLAQDCRTSAGWRMRSS